MKGREAAGDDGELQSFYGPTTVGMTFKDLSTQSGMLTAGHRVNSFGAMRLRQCAILELCEHFSQCCRLKGHRQASVGGLLERELVKISVGSLRVEFVSG